ncbi:DMT family transporter [uncultured Roseobacter sp.]|uniref:DMT family transporter n=1 Tax=uncultured Roseobacter sp. TaxID=114847 RepID=UPI002626A6A1|nr:DMT family transporter [uncultured Roseobacter sp.]
MSAGAQGHIAMLAFSALVAGSFSLGADAAAFIDPGVMNAARFAIASLIIGVAAAVTTGLPRAAFRASWRYLLLGGMLATYFVLMFEGLKTAAPVSAAAVFTLTPVMAGVAGWLMLGQRSTPRMMLALLLGGGGALWVIFRADLGALIAFEIGRGEAIYFVGCIAHAVYTPMVRKLNRGEPAVIFTFGTLAAGTVLLGVWSGRDLMATEWTALPPVVWVTLAYIAVCASAATFVLLQFATLRLPSAKVMAYTYLTPSWVIAWEVARGQDIPGAPVLGGVGLTILALILLLRDEVGSDGMEPSAPARR